MKIIKKIFLTLFILILLAGVGIVGGLAYFGMIPGLSEVLGANKARDLGVQYSKVDYDSFGSKLNGDVIPITKEVEPKDSIAYSGKIEVNKDFSQEELSARLNYGQWKHMPVKNVQIRINPDGSIEASGNVNMANLPGFIAYAGMGKYTMEDVTEGLDFIKMIKVDPPVYMKVRASVTNNEASGTIESLQVGKFDVPLGEIDATGALISVFESVTERAPSFYAKSITFSDGKMQYDGSLPAQMLVEVKQR